MREYTVTLSPKQFIKLCAALRAHGTKAHAARDRDTLRVLTMFISGVSVR